MMLLSIRRKDAQTREVEISGDTALLGKHADCDVVLDDSMVSRRHARIRLEGKRIVVEDLGSTNGTEVGGKPLQGARIAEAGEEIRIGPFSILATVREQADVPRPRADVPPPNVDIPRPAQQTLVEPAQTFARTHGTTLGPLAPLMDAD